MQDWTSEFALFFTLLKESSDVIFDMSAGISPLVFPYIRWLISSYTLEYSNA